jgi:hypothetical protein
VISVPNIEEQIHKAVEEGKFKDLPGTGKTLNLEDDSLLDPDWRMAYHVLRSGGYSLSWIEARKELLNDLHEARTTLRRSWEWLHEMQTSDLTSSLAQEEWQRAEVFFRKRMSEINQRIRNYNLEAPAMQFQLTLLDADKELNQLK